VTKIQYLFGAALFPYCIVRAVRVVCVARGVRVAGAVRAARGTLLLPLPPPLPLLPPLLRARWRPLRLWRFDAN